MDMDITLREIIYDVSDDQDLNQNNIKALIPFKNYKNIEQVRSLYILKDFYDKLSAYPFVP